MEGRSVRGISVKEKVFGQRGDSAVKGAHCLTNDPWIQHKTQNTQNTKHKTQNTNHKTQNTKYKTVKIYARSQLYLHPQNNSRLNQSFTNVPIVPIMCTDENLLQIYRRLIGIYRKHSADLDLDSFGIYCWPSLEQAEAKPFRRECDHAAFPGTWLDLLFGVGFGLG